MIKDGVCYMGSRRPRCWDCMRKFGMTVGYHYVVLFSIVCTWNRPRMSMAINSNGPNGEETCSGRF